MRVTGCSCIAYFGHHLYVKSKNLHILTLVLKIYNYYVITSGFNLPPSPLITAFSVYILSVITW